jgi:hypothetical protein
MMLEKSNTFAERGLKIFNDWGEISHAAATILINRREHGGARSKTAAERIRSGSPGHRYGSNPLSIPAFLR